MPPLMWFCLVPPTPIPTPRHFAVSLIRARQRHETTVHKPPLWFTGRQWQADQAFPAWPLCWHSMMICCDVLRLQWWCAVIYYDDTLCIRFSLTLTASPSRTAVWNQNCCSLQRTPMMVSARETDLTGLVFFLNFLFYFKFHAILVNSTLFSQMLFKHKTTCVMTMTRICTSDRFGSLSFSLIPFSWLTGRWISSLSQSSFRLTLWETHRRKWRYALKNSSPARLYFLGVKCPVSREGHIRAYYNGC